MSDLNELNHIKWKTYKHVIQFNQVLKLIHRNEPIRRKTGSLEAT
jgi:hypothetical protein